MKKTLKNWLSKFSLQSHWIVLLIAISIAASTWVIWSKFGPQYARRLLTTTVEAPATSYSNRGAEAPLPASDASATATSQALTEYGQVGDSFGGLNAFLTALAGAFVFWAGFMQHQTLKEARQEAERERAYRHKQEFESLFFQLLALSALAAEKVERKISKTSTVNPDIRRGSRALDSYAASLYQSVDPEQIGATPERVLKKMVMKFYTTAYDRNPSVFGPYYRMLLQVFQHVADSGLSEESQQRYASIARGQISEGAALLLALYGLSKAGHKFRPLIEKFSLLAHMHRRHFKAYSTALLIGYRHSVFTEKHAPGTGDSSLLATALLTETYFDLMDEDRESADRVSDFDNGYDPNSPTDE